MTAGLEVTPAELQHWLLARGWAQERLKSYASIWTKDGSQVLVPNDRTTVDYRARLREALQDLALEESVSADDLLLEIAAGASDIISWRFFGDVAHGGLIPLGNAAEYVVNIKRAFVAAASSTVFRRAFFGRRVPTAARLLADDVQLAPTRAGSYVFPTSVRLQTLERTTDELPGDNSVYEPFERRAALSLATGIKAVQAILESQSHPTAANTVELASRGVSYELCAALVGLLGDRLSVEVSFEWSRSVELRDEAPRRARLKSSDAHEVQSLADLMYGSTSTGAQTFLALVTTLHQDDPRAANGGSVRMRTVGRGETKLLLADLGESFYRVALRSHELRTPLELDGRLVEPPGHRSRVEDITDVRIPSQGHLI